jgi:hypothetical protein
MKKYLIIGTILIVSILIVGYFVITQKEVDDVAENGPIQSEIIPILDQVPLFENVLAAGISWDYDNDRFFISTDQPHGIFVGNKASFIVVNADLNQITYKKEFETDGDWEGIAYIGKNEVAIISEVGTIYYLKENGNEWIEASKVSIFNSNGKHKLSSLAYDPENEYLYSAEKEGKKIIYQISRSGEMINSFEFSVGNIAANREFNIDKDYTIAGIAHGNQHLYIFSEAYSTIFKYNPETKQVIRVFGVNKMHESAGITLKKGVAYLVGDFESYLPTPNFYKVEIPD